ncbi:hypothetical protein LCGC14_2880020, partial [marine sediment metagenome]
SQIPFSFTYGGKRSADLLPKWDSKAREKKIDKTSVRRTAFVHFVRGTLELEQDAGIRESIGETIRSISAEVGGVGEEGLQLWDDITAAKPVGKPIYELGRRAFRGPR